MTRPPTLHPAPAPGPTAGHGRRVLGRALLGGVAATAVSPMLADQASAAARAPVAKARGKRKFHRCRVHRGHTCWTARTCKHRNHRPAADGQADDGPAQGPGHGSGHGTGGATSPGTTPVTTQPILGDLPSAGALHLASRFTYGMTPALHEEMKGYGTAEAWLDAQLAPSTVADPVADQLQGWWPSLDLDAPTIWRRDQDKTEAAWVAMANYQRWCLLRRIYSRRQVLEVMTEFFENHLHVPVNDDGVFGFRSSYGKLIRSHALGRFDQMLVASTVHPAMGISLDNATSTKKAPNENLGRELLELHTVGRGNHTEDDVKNSARILTGYRVDMWSTWRDYYDPNAHWTGAVQVLGFSHANAAADGRPVTAAYLTYLAHHPATARRLARKLAIRFVADEPSEALVDHLAQVYLANDTAIVPVLRALVAHPDFAAAAGTKVRTPTDDVVATWRALDVAVARPVDDSSAANAVLWQTSGIGQAPFGWARPDGQPESGRAWSSASRLLASFESHYNMAGGWWPRNQATYRPLSSWVPVSAGESIRFDALVEHLSRSMLCRSATLRVVTACCQATGLSAGTAISLNHNLVKWGMPVLITTLLDSPEHLSR